MKATEFIEFDTDTLVQNKPSKIIYSGILCTDSDDTEIYIRFGYGPLWDSLQEIKLSKVLENYEGEINFLEYGNTYYCFRDNKNNWDNNSGNNYQIVVEKSDNLFQEEENFLLPIEVPRLKRGYLIRKKIRFTIIKAFRFISKIFKRKDPTDYDFHGGAYFE